MGQTYCATFCGEGDYLKEYPSMMANDIDEPNCEFARKVKSHIELHPKIKYIYVNERTPHPKQRNGVQLDLYYLYPFSAYYLGSWQKGLPHGFGRLIYDDGSIYEGCFNHGKAECTHALFIKEDGSFYKGNIKNNKANGYGELSAYKLLYKGQWKDDLPHGEAVEIYSSVSFYQGSFVNGLKEGFGTYQWNLGESYKGMFHQNVIHGRGQQKTQEYTYIGEFRDGKKQGNGQYIDSSSEYTFEGNFQNNQPVGQGIIIYKDGTKFIGQFNGFSKRKGHLIFLSGQQLKIDTQTGEQSQSIEIMQKSFQKHEQEFHLTET